MNNVYTVLTPENVRIEYQAAGMAPRLTAFLLDLLLQAAAISLVAGLVMAAASLFHKAVPSIEVLATFMGYIAIFLLMFGYYVFFEMVWNGMSPGKRALGLRVMRSDGLPITLQCSLIRNLMRIADLGLVPISPVLFLFGTPALVCMLFSVNFERLGDYAASTVVVLEEGIRPLGEKTHFTQSLKWKK